MKYCIDCKYFKYVPVLKRPLTREAICIHHKALMNMDPVCGAKVYARPNEMRLSRGACNVDAKLFEPRESWISRIFGVKK
jgi:hypothetical protein